MASPRTNALEAEGVWPWPVDNKDKPRLLDRQLLTRVTGQPKSVEVQGLVRRAPADIFAFFRTTKVCKNTSKN